MSRQFTSNGRKPLFAAALLCLAMTLAACANSSRDEPALATSASTEDASGNSAGGGINVEAGTEEDFMVNAGRRVFFKQSSAQLDDTARVTLDKQAQWLQRYPSWKVKLQGFADDPGSAAQQSVLSQKRAEAVRDYLASQGVAPDRMKAKGYGRDRLIGDCPDIECKAQNRRVITNPQEAPDF